MNMRIEPSVLANPDLQFATLSSGISLPYVERGSGAPMVFVHGSLCDYRYWDPQLASLSAHYRCIAPSLSHYWPAVEAGIQDEFSWQNHVDELAEFIDALDLGPVPGRPLARRQRRVQRRAPASASRRLADPRRSGRPAATAGRA